VISGGEQGRMLFGKLMLQKPNIMVLDEPTNHLDMESIESLNLALENYPGTLIFVSHDREFVSSLATRILELTAAPGATPLGRRERSHCDQDCRDSHFCKSHNDLPCVSKLSRLTSISWTM
jgi:ATPase subunit of ABC transporter with duplicated ATPase domains